MLNVKHSVTNSDATFAHSHLLWLLKIHLKRIWQIVNKRPISALFLSEPWSPSQNLWKYWSLTMNNPFIIPQLFIPLLIQSINGYQYLKLKLTVTYKQRRV